MGVERVARACEPCGALARWIQAIILEHSQRKQIQPELSALEPQLKIAEERRSFIEREAAAVEEDLVGSRRRLAEAKKREEQLRERAKRVPPWLEEMQPDSGLSSCAKVKKLGHIEVSIMQLDLGGSSCAKVKHIPLKPRHIEVSMPVQDGPVFRLSPGARSRATHQRIMISRCSGSLPCLALRNSWDS